MNTFAALADPTRLRIFELIAQGEKSVNEIVKHFSFTPPTISQHLKVLRQAHLVLVRSEGQRRYYAVDQQGFKELEAWIQQMSGHWNTHLDDLEDLLRDEQNKGKS